MSGSRHHVSFLAVCLRARPRLHRRRPRRIRRVASDYGWSGLQAPRPGVDGFLGSGGFRLTRAARAAASATTSTAADASARAVLIRARGDSELVHPSAAGLPQCSGWTGTVPPLRVSPFLATPRTRAVVAREVARDSRESRLPAFGKLPPSSHVEVIRRTPIVNSCVSGAGDRPATTPVSEGSDLRSRQTPSPANPRARRDLTLWLRRSESSATGGGPTLRLGGLEARPHGDGASGRRRCPGQRPSERGAATSPCCPGSVRTRPETPDRRTPP